VVLVNSLNGEVVKVWAVADPVLQFLEKLSPEKCSCQVFVIEEEEEKKERVALDMAHLRVVPAVINGIREEEVLLDSSSQIVSMTKKVAAANKVSWDPSLSIQIQSANGLLSRTCRLAKNVPFTLHSGKSNGTLIGIHNRCGALYSIVGMTI